MALGLTIKSGEVIKVGEALIRLKKRGGEIRVAIEAPKEVEIKRLGAVKDLKAPDVI